MARRKTADCVALQHRGGDAVHEATKGMTREEEIAYWEQQSREFRAEVEARRRAHKRAASRSGPSTKLGDGTQTAAG